MNNILLALTPTEAPMLVLKIIGAFLGAFIGGFLVGLIGKILFRRSGLGIFLMRLLGAGGGGVLMWMFISGGGLGGFGWGNPGNGEKDSGTGSKDKPADQVAKDEVKPPPKDNNDKGPAAKELLRVAVLGAKPLQDLFKTDAVDFNRCYRIEGEDKKQVFDLKGLRKELLQRRETIPNLRVLVVIYKDSPDQDNDLVAELKQFLEDEKMYKDYDRVRGYAPR